jgi:hypothetical protein
MLAHDIPPTSSVGNQRRTRASPQHRQLAPFVAAGLLGPHTHHEAKKRRNVEFSLGTDHFCEYKPGSPLRLRIPPETQTTDRVLSQLATREEDPRVLRKKDTGTLSRPHPKPHHLDGRQPSDYQPDQRSPLVRIKAQRNSMLAAKGRESRRERTFIGSQCAACEEPLEHTLRGERILQLSCGHVAHEACFYEYIQEFEAQNCPTCDAPLGLDPSRGAGIDFEHLNKLVRSAQAPEHTRDTSRDAQATPTPVQWQPAPPQPQEPTNTPRARQQNRNTREHLLPERARSSTHRHEQRYDTSSQGHGRNMSGETGMMSNPDYAETHNHRRHDYDVQSMETRLSGRIAAKNPIPAPTVTVRSEFPTLSKSRQQQSLTCLVTVEVVDGKWQANAEDMRAASSHQSNHGDPPRKAKSFQSQESHRAIDSVHEQYHHKDNLDGVKAELFQRVDVWHGLDISRFGRLILHGTMRVGKDRQSWQELECYLFEEMLICVKEKKTSSNESQHWDGAGPSPKTKGKCTLKGSILIKKHLKEVEFVERKFEPLLDLRSGLTIPEYGILTLSLSVAELPHFHLMFSERPTLDLWRKALANLDTFELPEHHSEYEQDTSTDEDDYRNRPYSSKKRASSAHSSTFGANRSQATAPTEYTNSRAGGPDMRLSASPVHVPLDVVVVIPVSSSMQGLKINLLRDALRFLVSHLGENDRMGLVTFGSAAGGVPLVGMTSKNWKGWSQILNSIRPVGQKSMRADVVEGANVAMDLLMQRKSANPLSSIMLISDSPTSDADSVDFVVSRAEAAKISIHSFGLGLTHKPDTMVELSTRTKASYTYVKDWMMLRECVAGCLGSLQTISHQNVKVKLRIPEGSPAKFVKISGALQITKRATGRDAEASLGDLRFGDKRDILVQLSISPDNSTPDHVPSDPWENMISGLEALGGPFDQDEMRTLSVEELPLLQADLSWGDILREGHLAHASRPSLLAITMLPSARKNSRAQSPPIPPHPHVVQRRMELLTSDMLSRSLTLVSRGQNERGHHLLAETRSILKGLGKGGLPPLPPPPKTAEMRESPTESNYSASTGPRAPSPLRQDGPNAFTPAAGIDTRTMAALDYELESALEWIGHPAVFSRDSRKAVLQTIGVISSQRGISFRTPSESLWAARIPGIKNLTEQSREWREAGDDSLAEEM